MHHNGKTGILFKVQPHGLDPQFCGISKCSFYFPWSGLDDLIPILTRSLRVALGSMLSGLGNGHV